MKILRWDFKKHIIKRILSKLKSLEKLQKDERYVKGGRLLEKKNPKQSKESLTKNSFAYYCKIT